MLVHRAWVTHHHCPLAQEQSLMGGVGINVNPLKKKKVNRLTDGSIAGSESGREAHPQGGCRDMAYLHVKGYAQIDDREVHLASLLRAPGDRLGYVYNLGMYWEHNIQVTPICTLYFHSFVHQENGVNRATL